MKEIPLTQGKVALVDDEDYERVNQFKWHARREGNCYYAGLNVVVDGRRGYVKLHQFILGEKGIDHRDGSGLNNQRENLRRATKQQNGWAHRKKSAGAVSKYRGVSWDSIQGQWKARLKLNYREVWLGRFDSEEAAARAYDKAARELFGEFASPNFP